MKTNNNIDAVKLMREQRDRLSQEFANMTFAEQKQAMRAQLEKFRLEHQKIEKESVHVG